MLIQVDKEVTEAQEYQAWIDAIYRMARSEFDDTQQLYRDINKTALGQDNHQAAAQVEGLGQLVAQYDANMWFQARHKDKHHWEDEASIKRYKEDNPEVLVTK